MIGPVELPDGRISEAVVDRPPVPPVTHTLGWQALEWAEEYLIHAHTEEPIMLSMTDEMIDFILTHYAIDDDGRWLYSRSALRRARGTSKSPTAAILACIELCGPCRFDGWDANGMPVAKPVDAPWIFVVASTLAQTEPIMDIALNSFSDEALERYQISIGRRSAFKSGRVDGGGPGRMAGVPNNPRSMRGPRPSAVFAEEVTEWVPSNRGVATMTRIRSNLAKSKGGIHRLIELGNAPVPDEDSHAESTLRAHLEQKQKYGRSRINYNNLEADPALDLTNPDQLRLAIRQASGDADWLDVETLVGEAQDGGVSIATFRREHLNQITAKDGALVHPHQIDALSKDTRPLSRTDEYTIGFDGSLTGDGTAIVAFRPEDRSFHVIGYWEPPADDENWKLDEAAVDMIMRSWLEDEKTLAAACDVHPFESWVYAWESDFGHRFPKVSNHGRLVYDNRHNRVDRVFTFMALIEEIERGTVRFASDTRFKTHFGNAVRWEVRSGFLFGKVSSLSTKKVDIVAACHMAYIAHLAVEKNGTTESNPGAVVQLA